MKHILLMLFALYFCLNITAQEIPGNSKIFVRVYNLEGKKISKGKIFKITDTSLVLKKGKKLVTISSSEISYIKTKKSKGHAVLRGAMPGGVLLVSSILDPGWATIGGIIFLNIGAATGYLYALIFQKSIQYTIGGDPIKWKAFKEKMYSPQY